ncbi:MAG TPA: DNA methyltransferase [Thermoplasmata archaeon]|nr:DNA methyltransferase [Thermoplasmata archaeon]
MSRTGRGAGAPGRPRLNDLTGREWIRFTRSWFIGRPPPRSPKERAHPAKFPEALAEEFVRFFTRRGEWVLDPFAGTGTTLVAARRLGRPSLGVELNPEFVRLSTERLGEELPRSATPAEVVHGDARRVEALWRARKVPAAGLVLTSPPYWDMLRQGRGGVRSVHRRRAEAGLATRYSADPYDLGNLAEYDQFLDELVPILRSAGTLLAPGKYLVVVLQNLRDPQGKYRALAWDIARRLDAGALEFQGERIWCQDSKPLGIWGFPVTFVPNIHHHYCLIFRRAPDPATGATSTAPTRGGAVSRSRGRTRRASRRPPTGGAARSARR